MKIKHKLTTGFLGISLLVGIVGGVAIKQQLETARYSAIKDAENVADTIANSITFQDKNSAQPLYKSQQRLQDYIEEINKIQKRDLEVVNVNKKIIADAVREDVGSILKHDLKNEVGLTMKDGIPRRFTEKLEDSKVIQQIVVPLRSEDTKIIGAIILEYTPLYDDIMAQVKQPILIIIIASIACISLAIVLGGLISTSISQPIQKLNKAVLDVAEGNIDTKVDIKSNDEIGELADSFNKMSSDLTKVSRELISAKKYEETLNNLRKTQSQLIQAEKMSSLGQMVAGIAHEINNPVNFIYGNLTHANEYIQDLLGLLHLYQQQYPNPTPEIQDQVEAIDIDYLVVDLSKMLSSMKLGSERIRQIVVSLRNFSRLDEAEIKAVDIHEGIDSTLLILNHRKQDIEIVKNSGNLPLLDCYPAQLNQVFMNILSNAIDALLAQEQYNKQIVIQTEIVDEQHVQIKIWDNGPGIPTHIKEKIFDPFFTTKPVGQGTGLGLSICYQIIEKHYGKIEVTSAPGQGTEFAIALPTKSLSETES